MRFVQEADGQEAAAFVELFERKQVRVGARLMPAVPDPDHQTRPVDLTEGEEW